MLFLPGASGDGGFWRPVGEQLPTGWEKVYLAWPGLGDQPDDSSVVRAFDDLAGRVAGALGDRGDLVAHSMGGIVAIQVARRHPEKVRRLVLCAASGGVDVGRLGGADWREDYLREFPRAATWILKAPPDQTEDLELVTAPVLLLWGDEDPISPVSVGRHLASLLPRATLEVITGGGHDFPTQAHHTVAAKIAAHLG